MVHRVTIPHVKDPDQLEVEINAYRDESELSIQRITTRSTIAAIPYAGSALLEIIDGLAQRRVQERLNCVLDEIKNRLHELGDEKIDREFFRSEEFQTLLFLLLERLHTTHDRDKLRMFGKALANASSTEFTADDKEEYIRVLRELSANDLKVLNHEYLKGWTPHIHNIDYAAEVLVSLSRLQGMGLVLEHVKVREVPAGGTGSGRLDARMAASNLLTQPARRTFALSEFGRRFLQFISVQVSPTEGPT
jgi:hypothetical protein